MAAKRVISDAQLARRLAREVNGTPLSEDAGFTVRARGPLKGQPIEDAYMSSVQADPATGATGELDVARFPKVKAKNIRGYMAANAGPLGDPDSALGGWGSVNDWSTGAPLPDSEKVVTLDVSKAFPRGAGNAQDHGLWMATQHAVANRQKAIGSLARAADGEVTFSEIPVGDRDDATGTYRTLTGPGSAVHRLFGPGSGFFVS